mgnify:CR=1 FL=1
MKVPQHSKAFKRHLKLQQLEHKLQVDGDPEYSHLLESLSTPALEEIIVSAGKKPRPFIERLLHNSLPDAARRKLVLLIMRPKLLEILALRDEKLISDTEYEQARATFR